MPLVALPPAPDAPPPLPAFLPGGGPLPRPYYDIYDPFLALNTAAAATTTLKIGTGIALVVQRDPIVTAKMVSSIDQLSQGRFLFGVGNGWNRDEIENHGTAFGTRNSSPLALMSPRTLALAARARRAHAAGS